jgi:hypothetical protein
MKHEYEDPWAIYRAVDTSYFDREGWGGGDMQH